MEANCHLLEVQMVLCSEHIDIYLVHVSYIFVSKLFKVSELRFV